MRIVGNQTTTGAPPPLVLLHGGGLDSARTTWGPVWADLVAGGPVLAPDLPGFGTTALGDTSPSVAGYRAWLLALLDALEVDRCVLVGLSLGGAVALETTITAPDRVAALGLLAPYGISPQTPGGRAGWAAVHLPGAARATYALLRRSPRALHRSLGVLLRRPGSLDDALVAEVRALLDVPQAGHAWQQLQRGEVGWSGPATDLRPRLASVACPAVLISGEHDLVDPEDVRAAAEVMQDARFVLIPGAGHWLPRDAPAEIAAEIDRLRARTSSTTEA